MEKALRWAKRGDTTVLRNPGECRICIIGVGGCGNNTVNRIMGLSVDYVECIAINTDIQHLNLIRADSKILIGKKITRGLGAGCIPKLGRQAMLENVQDLIQLITDRDIVFIAAGLGGGTGTGAAPLIAELAREQGVLVIGVVTMPFHHERKLYSYALQGLTELRRHAHTVIVVDNDKLVQTSADLPLETALGVADRILGDTVKGIVETITIPSLINIDFADLRTVMKRGRVAIMGMGEAIGPYRATEAARKALDHILLDTDHSEADGALIHVSGGSNMTLRETVKAAEKVTEMVNDEAMVIWGSRIDPSLGDKLRVTVMLTGIKSPHLVGGFGLEDTELYNLEPLSGPDTKLELDLGLYNMEWDI
jgi:cell division protein FtsZ